MTILQLVNESFFRITEKEATILDPVCETVELDYYLIREGSVWSYSGQLNKEQLTTLTNLLKSNVDLVRLTKK